MNNWIIVGSVIGVSLIAASIYARQKKQETKIIPEQAKSQPEAETQSVETKNSHPFSFLQDTFNFITLPELNPKINYDAIGGDFTDTGQAKARSRQ